MYFYPGEPMHILSGVDRASAALAAPLPGLDHFGRDLDV
jgi:hypothetical protein